VGIRHRIVRSPVLDSKQAYVICPNHTSFLDIILTYIVIPNYFHFMGKAELRKVPLFNIFFNKMNILVDRGSIIGSHRAFLRASRDLDKNISIAIFPEATIPESAPRLGRVKNGAFKLAIDKQVPIIPVVYLDNWRLLPDGERRKTGGTPGVSRVVIHDPIETRGMTENDLSALKKKYLEILDSTLTSYGCQAEADKLTGG
jgi:1-acyl-sn-glycerol-3-phosphate acyltransferase